MQNNKRLIILVSILMLVLLICVWYFVSQSNTTKQLYSNNKTVNQFDPLTQIPYTFSDCENIKQTHTPISLDLLKNNIKSASVYQGDNNKETVPLAQDEIERLISDVQLRIDALGDHEYTSAEVSIRSLNTNGWITVFVRASTGAKTSNFGGPRPSGHITSVNNAFYDDYDFRYRRNNSNTAYEYKNASISGYDVADNYQKCALYVASRSEELHNVISSKNIVSLDIKNWVPQGMVKSEWSKNVDSNSDLVVVGASLAADQNGCDYLPVYLLVDPLSQKVIDTQFNSSFASCPERW